MVWHKLRLACFAWKFKQRLDAGESDSEKSKGLWSLQKLMTLPSSSPNLMRLSCGWMSWSGRSESRSCVMAMLSSVLSLNEGSRRRTVKVSDLREEVHVWGVPAVVRAIDN
jgi:hypothetical protein